MNTSLLIMAAGIGSRFGGGIKQLESVDNCNHIIMDYSIHDAIKAGFNDIIFVIRKDIENDFKAAIGNRIEDICKKANVNVYYAFQEIENIPRKLPEGRTKPFGTGHAVLSAKEYLNNPFMIINADDYYGKDGFKSVHEYLANENKSCMAGFVLENTLSDNGVVTRGICKMNDDGFLSEIVETKNILKTADGAETDGVKLDPKSLVSMNMWGLTPDFLNQLEAGFVNFFNTDIIENPLKSEFLIPTFIGSLLKNDEIEIKVLKSNDVWYGMTYKEDVKTVKDAFASLIKSGEYSEDLYSDIV